MKKRILIIGGNGFIGTNLSYELACQGYDVTCFDLVTPEKKNDKVKYISGDFFDNDTLEKITDNTDVIIHAISTVNPGNSNIQYMRGYEKDFIQTVHLCRMVIDKGLKMIFLSSGGTVYGNQSVQPIMEDVRPQPINHYGNIKLCIENTIRTFNTQLHTKMLIARISNPYGPGQDYNRGVGFIDATLKKAINKENIEIWGDGTNERDYIYISDACRMIESLIDYNGTDEVFNISINRGVSQNEILDIVRGMGVDVTVNYVEGRSVDAKKIVLDNTRIRNIYNEELISPEEGIRKYYEYLKTNMAR